VRAFRASAARRSVAPGQKLTITESSKVARASSTQSRRAPPAAPPAAVLPRRLPRPTPRPPPPRRLAGRPPWPWLSRSRARRLGPWDWSRCRPRGRAGRLPEDRVPASAAPPSATPAWPATRLGCTRRPSSTQALPVAPPRSDWSIHWVKQVKSEHAGARRVKPKRSNRCASAFDGQGG
jgi:hypothetical protein